MVLSGRRRRPQNVGTVGGPLVPSPLYSGERARVRGWRETARDCRFPTGPHPNPLPEYRERGKRPASACPRKHRGAPRVQAAMRFAFLRPAAVLPVTLAFTLVTLAAAPPTTRPATSPAAAVSPDAARRVRELVTRLSAEHWKDRDAAERQLVEMGPEIEPLLREIARTTAGPEAASRLKVVLAELEGRRWTGPTLVTLRLKDAPPGRVFEEIFRQ